MLSPQIEKVLVAPGEGRKVPLRVPGTSIMVPAEGKSIPRTRAVNRLLRTGDLVIVQPKAAAAPAAANATPAVPASTATKSDAKEG